MTPTRTTKPASPNPARRPGGAGGGAGFSPRVLIVLIGLGLLLRWVVAAVSWGTNDALTFLQFGAKIDRSGLFATYRADPDLNHPPIPAYWAYAAFSLTARHPWAFSFVFKAPVILADAATVWLLCKILRPRFGPRGALAGAALYAWSPDAILVSGYHCNTDPVYSLLILLCVYLFQDRGRHFWAGAALGAAVNVKLTPLLLAPVLLLNCRDWKQAGRLLAGLSLGVVPFLPILLGPADVWAGFRRNALDYKSQLDKWGINVFLLPAGDRPPTSWAPRAPYVVYYSWARYLILAAVGLWAVATRVMGRWNLYEAAAVTLALFLVLTAGFGVQYTVMVLPLLVVIRPRLANVYGAVAGLFLAVVYFINWTGEYPLYSFFDGFFPMPSPYLGLVAWGTLVAFILIALKHPADRAGPVASAEGEGMMG